MNESTQVYLNNYIPSGDEPGKNNLKDLTCALNNGQRTQAQIYAILRGMGIDEMSAKFAIETYYIPLKEPVLAHINPTLDKNNNMQMIQFNLASVEENLKTLSENLNVLIKNDNNRLNYSATEALNRTNSILGEIHSYNMKIKDINEAEEKDKALYKSRINECHFKSKPEFNFLKKSMSQLNAYSHLVEVSNYIKECNNIFETYKYTYCVSNLIYELNSTPNNTFYSSVIEDLSFLSRLSEDEIRVKIPIVLEKHNWVPSIKQLIEYNAQESKVLVSKSEVKVNRVYSPVQVNEDNSIIFILDNILYKLYESEITVLDNKNEVNSIFWNSKKALDRFVIEGENFVLYSGKNMLEITPDRKISLNGKLLEYKNNNDIKDALIASSFYKLNELYKIDEMLFFLENLNNISELDYVTSITNRVNGLKINLIKVDENIYINRINGPSNEILLAQSVTDAQTLVNEYFVFDITNKVSDLLESENKIKFELEKQKESLIDDLKYLEDKKEVLERENLILNAVELLEAVKIINNEIKDKEVKLQEVYSKLNTNVALHRKMLDKGYVSGTISKSEKGFNENAKVFINAVDYSSKGINDEISIMDSEGIKKSKIKKKNLILDI